MPNEKQFLERTGQLNRISLTAGAALNGGNVLKESDIIKGGEARTNHPIILAVRTWEEVYPTSNL